MASKASDDCVIVGNFMCLAHVHRSCAYPSLYTPFRGGGSISIVLMFIRQVVPLGFSLGLPALKTPVGVLGGPTSGAPTGEDGVIYPDFYFVNDGEWVVTEAHQAYSPYAAQCGWDNCLPAFGPRTLGALSPRYLCLFYSQIVLNI